MSRKKPKFSIIMASYNYAQYLSQSIESVINQSYKNWELIIVDDGSQDNSIEIINSYCSKYNNIHFYTHKNNQNKGLKETLLLGLSKTSGEFVAFLESDDYWHKDNLEYKARIAETNKGVKFIYNAVNFTGNEEDILQWKKMHNYKENTDKKDKYEYCAHDFLHYNKVLTFSAFTVKTSLFKSLNFKTPFDAWLDWWLLQQIAFSHKFYFINQAHTYWRISNKSYINVSKRTKIKQKEFYNKIILSYACQLFKLKYLFNKEINLLIFMAIIKCLNEITIFNKLFRGTMNKIYDSIEDKYYKLLKQE